MICFNTRNCPLSCHLPYCPGEFWGSGRMPKSQDLHPLDWQDHPERTWGKSYHFLDAIASPSQWVSEWFVVSDLEIAITSPSFARLFYNEKVTCRHSELVSFRPPPHSQQTSFSPQSGTASVEPGYTWQRIRLKSKKRKTLQQNEEQIDPSGPVAPTRQGWCVPRLSWHLRRKPEIMLR